MKESVYRTYEELPLFLNAETVAQTGVPTFRLPMYWMRALMRGVEWLFLFRAGLDGKGLNRRCVFP